MGATLVPLAKGSKPSVQNKGKKETRTTVTKLTVPHGPWAKQELEVQCREEVEPLKTEEDPQGDAMRTSLVNFTLSLR